MIKLHSFHIPVMGVGFTVDTPLKVSQFGIDSVVFISDDNLLEKLRKKYSEKYKFIYNEITTKAKDYRAKRITAYLNLIDRVTKFQRIELNKKNLMEKYMAMLPNDSEIKQNLNKSEPNYFSKQIAMGSIDVNIMTKLDRENTHNGIKLPVEYNDAHAALRGYAQSDLKSSIVFSAGMNPRLFSYLSGFKDFYPNKDGFIKKKIILKVSDYRSAFIQGKYLAKKGLWVSEYRVESGLNCGGHAFATDGFLMGPVLEEFSKNRNILKNSVYEILEKALTTNGKTIPNQILPIKITAQGGVGTAEEHQFLIEKYKIDSVGWGSPFLLVPEATSVDEPTLEKLVNAKEDDLYLSKISPLGIRFNNLKGGSKELEKHKRIDMDKPGSPCVKKHLAFNTEFTEKPICTASSKYQKLKIEQLKTLDLNPDEYQKKYNEVVDKECLCMGLSESVLLNNNFPAQKNNEGVTVCPGPNLAYFSKIVSLKEMIDHIYGRVNVLERTDRPNMFIKELRLYIDYLKEKNFEMTSSIPSKKEKKYLYKFINNLDNGITYYKNLFNDVKNKFEIAKSDIFEELNTHMQYLSELTKKLDS